MQTKLANNRRDRHEWGFTLVELLIVMSIAAIVVLATLTLYLSLLNNAADQQARMVNQDSARLAIYEMSRYLRAACSSESNLTSLSDAIAVAAPWECVFYADVDSDQAAERVRFFVDNKTLRGQTAEPDLAAHPPTYPVGYETDGTVILSGVQNGEEPVFTYLAYGAEAASLFELEDTSTADLRRKIVAIALRLVVNEEPKTARGQVELVTRVQIRERYDGGLDGG